MTVSFTKLSKVEAKNPKDASFQRFNFRGECDDHPMKSLGIPFHFTKFQFHFWLWQQKFPKSFYTRAKG